MNTCLNHAAPPVVFLSRSFFHPNRHQFDRKTDPFQFHHSKRGARIFNCLKNSYTRKSPRGCDCTVSASTENAGNGYATGAVRILALVGEGSVSPLQSTLWSEVMFHTAEKLKWVDEGFEMLVCMDTFNHQVNAESLSKLQEKLCHTDILIIVAVMNQNSVDWIQANCREIENVMCFDSSPALKNRLRGSVIQTENRASMLTTFPFQKQSRESEEVARTVFEAWDRRNSDDILFCLLVIVNACIKPVSTLNNLRAKGLSTLKCMVNNCGRQILNCLFDPNCRKALQCLNACSPTDQVCNYRCIASYESPQLEEFSLCVLQKHNCLELDAKIPEKPRVIPMASFRGEDLSHDSAEDLFVGWLGNLDWSWRVVAGQNPAYDHFPCQYQLFYRGKARGSFWYEPVFQVRTLDGDLIWRRRKYRVKRGKVPGTFHLSVLDNGVVSSELWTIVEVCDDLRWGVFHYHGAARVAGLSYTGAVVVSPDGVYPPESERGRLGLALERCRIKEWELFCVDNCSCQNPPLGLPEGSRLHHKMIV